MVSDEEMLAAKGVQIMNLKERAILASCCKWVDEVKYFKLLPDDNYFNV